MKECPDNETISEYYDGELDKTSPEAVHIASCPECARILESYAAIDRALKEKLSVEIPSGLTEKVKKHIHRRINAEKRISIPFPTFLLRIAASLLVASVILAYMTNLVSDRKTKAPIPGKLTASLKNENKTVPSGDFGIIPLEDFVKASFKPASNAPAPLAGAPDKHAGKIKKSVKLRDKVYQVWVAKDIQELPPVISHLAEKIGIPSENARLALNDGKNATLNMTLSKAQLFDFVRLCRNSGYELLSPQAPQPEQKVQRGTENEEVNYNASFVLGHN